MTDSDDRIARRYRELAREEPPLAADGAILAAARRKVRSRPGFMRRWAGPVSIAAVLVLGIGVSLRMQLEQPGVETSPPETDYSKENRSGSFFRAPAQPSNAPPAAAPADSAAVPEHKPVAPQALEKRKQATPERLAPPKPAPAPAPPEEGMKDRRADNFRTEDANIIASPGAMAPIAPPAAAFVPAPAPAPARAPAPAAPAATTVPVPSSTIMWEAPPPARLEAEVGTRAVAEPPTAAGAVARQAPQAQLAAPRAKKEAAADAVSSYQMNKSIAPADAERDRELERIAKLRETGQHADADRALEAFRKRYPDFRIPEATWERVRPR